MSRTPGGGRTAVRTGVALLGGLVAATVAAALIAGRRWEREGARTVARLGARADSASATGTFDPAQLAGLPAPVARYFRFSLTPGQPLYRTARLVQEGEFALRPGAWRAMRAEQFVTISRPGFVWDASIGLVPGIAMRVRDEYSDGSAAMLGKVAGLVPVIDRRDTPGLAEGALLRWLAEAPGFPPALLPGAGVVWTAVDDSTARAAVTDAGLTVAMNVHFGAAGGIERVTALRYRDVDGRGIPTPFEGRSGEYRRTSGMMVPTRLEATWLLPEGPHTFFRARIVAASFGFDSRSRPSSQPKVASCQVSAASIVAR